MAISGWGGVLAVSLLLFPLGGRDLNAQYAITRSVLDMGGGVRSSSTYDLADAAGQTAVGVSSSSHYVLAAGFLAFGFGAPPGIEEPEGEGLMPRVYALSQNYPNPFNPRTVIRIEIPGKEGEEVPVRLEVFNLRGQRIRTLVDGSRSPGAHVVSWDGRDEHGQHAGSGVYLYRLTAGDFIATKKMVMVE
jgi:hypothetical protein